MFVALHVAALLVAGPVMFLASANEDVRPEPEPETATDGGNDW